MNDPFADEPGTQRPSKVVEFFSRLTQRHDEDDQTLQVPTTSTHQRTSSKQNSFFSTAHDRTSSQDIEDHMKDSQYSGSDICSACGYPRLSSIYCTVSSLHHGTDLPAETPSKKKKGSIFARIRDSMTGIDTEEDQNARSQPAIAVDSGSTTPRHEGDGTAPPSSPSFLAVFSKTKEEKQIAELVHQEEKDRKRIHENVKLSKEEIIRQLTTVHHQFREILKDQEKHRMELAHQHKVEADKTIAERKGEWEDLKKLWATEHKLALKKEKERRKHAVSEGDELRQASPERAPPEDGPNPL